MKSKDNILRLLDCLFVRTPLTLFVLFLVVSFVIFEKLSLPARCVCDVQLVAANALTVLAANGTVLGGCDDAFYTFGIPQIGGLTAAQVIQHEGVMMSAFFCCTILSTSCRSDAIRNNYTTDYTTAAMFCDNILGNIKDTLGLNLCPAEEATSPPDNTMPTNTPTTTTPPPNAPTMSPEMDAPSTTPSEAATVVPTIMTLMMALLGLLSVVYY